MLHKVVKKKNKEQENPKSKAELLGKEEKPHCSKEKIPSRKSQNEIVITLIESRELRK